LGYLIGSTTSIDDSEKGRIIQEIMQSQANLRNQQQSDFAGEEGGDNVNGIMSSSDLMNYQYNKYPFSDKWGDFVGQPSINFHAMVYGRPKQGKSILSVQWAKYLSENFGKVLYVASEEGFSVTLQKKVMEFAMDNNNLDFANFRDFEQIKNAVNKGKYKFVFIDSVNFIKITPEDVEDIKAENPSTAFITIQQATKNGNFRGSQEFAHNCDIVIRVEAGMASQQGRFQEPTEMNVFDSPENASKKEAPLMGASASQMDMFDSSDFGESNF
jgi:predicted ATP-dependent serine protease